MTELNGGLRSMEILKSLERSRFGAIAAARASRTIGELQWRPAQAGAIQRDDQRTTWHSGHVSAVLSDGQAILAGTQSGGVWLINPIPSPSFRDGYRATPLSDTWDTPNVRSLAYGPDGGLHVFVGCREADAVFLIELQAVTGALVVKRSDLTIPLPSRTSVYSIAVLADPRRIVIGTSHGVLWSEIPAVTTDVDSYAWQAAAGLPPGLCGSLTLGPGTSLAASASEATDDMLVSSLPPSDVPDRLFVGDWQDGMLAFEPAAVPEVAQSHVYGFVLASCFNARERMYGVAMGEEATIACVLRSDDGGRNWAPVSTPAGAGEQGYHNRAIAVSPYRPDVVALGWQAAGPFLSTDGGASWTFLSGGDGTDANRQPCPGSPRGLHSDLQHLSFPQNPLEADHLIIASDGGVVVTRDLGRCFDSQYNRNLGALQFYGGERQRTTLSVSSRFPGLLAGGTQDNGNVILHPDPDAGAVWHQLVGGDGGMTCFVDRLAALLHVNSDVHQVRMATWNAAARRFDGPGAVVPKEGDPGGLIPTALEAVTETNWGRNGQLLYACAGTTSGEVYGLFADGDGGNASFRRIADVEGSVTAVASLFGAEILVACSDGRILKVDSGTQLWSEQPQDGSGRGIGAVKRFEIFSSDHVYALKRRELLRFDGRQWTALPAEQDWLIFTADRFSGRLFAATPADVFSSADGGKTWLDASLGLPARPYCTDLRIGNDADGGSTLYLTTYGRSVWRAKITSPPDEGPNFDLPPRAREILFGVIQDGGGVVRVGGRLVRIPPRQPARDILAGLAVEETAQGMSAEAGLEVRRSALQQIARAVGRALERLR